MRVLLFPSVHLSIPAEGSADCLPPPPLFQMLLLLLLLLFHFHFLSLLLEINFPSNVRTYIRRTNWLCQMYMYARTWMYVRYYARKVGIHTDAYYGCCLLLTATSTYVSAFFSREVNLFDYNIREALYVRTYEYIRTYVWRLHRWGGSFLLDVFTFSKFLITSSVYVYAWLFSSESQP